MGHHAPITFSIVGSHLAPIADLIERSDVTEIALNREGEIWFEVAGEAQMHSRPQPEYSAEKLMRLANGLLLNPPSMSAQLTRFYRLGLMG